ncbi:MAG: hypothetical protein CMI63_17930 [Parvularcula sp.]|nr:hypothetical protein [Parvularcula sp.]
MSLPCHSRDFDEFCRLLLRTAPPGKNDIQRVHDAVSLLEELSINARSFYDLETLVWEAKSNANNELSKFKAAISQAEERLEACDELLSIVKSYRDSQPNAGKIQS